MPVSWRNSRQRHALQWKIPILKACPQKLYPWCCYKGDSSNHGTQTDEEQPGEKEEMFATRDYKQRAKENRFTGENPQMASHKGQTSAFLARLSASAFWIGTVFARHIPASTAAAGGKTHQTKAHGGWCSSLTALVQLQWVCHSELGGGTKTHADFSADRCSPVSRVVHCVQHGRASDVARFAMLREPVELMGVAYVDWLTLMWIHVTKTQSNPKLISN